MEDVGPGWISESQLCIVDGRGGRRACQVVVKDGELHEGGFGRLESG